MAALAGAAVGLASALAVAFLKRSAPALAGSNVEIWGNKTRQVNLWEERAFGFSLLGWGGIVLGWHWHFCIWTVLVLLGLTAVMMAWPLQLRAWIQATGYERRRRARIATLMAAILVTKLC